MSGISDITELKRICSQVRRDIIRMTHGAQSGHPGGSLGCTEFFVALYFNLLQHNPRKFSIDGINEDIFILSNGHISPVWYSVLSRSGYFNTKEMSTFRKINSRLQGHPATHEGLPGIRVASGSLGQGLSVAMGATLTKKLNNDNHLVYCLCGDGEMEEGQIWEAVMFGGAKKVDYIIVTVDVNGQQIDGSIESVLPYGDLKPKWESFGWQVLQMDGANIEEVISTLKKAKTMTGNKKPVVILMKTVMG